MVKKLQEKTRFIAQSMVTEAMPLAPNKKILINFDSPLGDDLAKNIVQILHQLKPQKIILFPRNLEKEVSLACQESEKPLNNYFSRLKKAHDWAEAVFLVRAKKNPEIFQKIPHKRQKIYDDWQHKISWRRVMGKVPWCLIYWPTEYEAKKENLAYETYFDLFWQACNQPWLEIKKSQKKLAEKLNQGRILQIEAHRTQLKMSIKGMTFFNSTIDENYPGSEVFSAPVLKSVEGQIFYPGEYQREGKLMKNIFLKFEKGRIKEFSAASGEKFLGEFLSRGKGARYLGEIAFGTNPGLKKRFFNPLLNEKVGGSIHLAIGHCYEIEKDNGGRSVKVNNGNTQDKTSIHWDLSLLMHPQYGGGKVILDGEIIQKNGHFLDPELKVLNPNFD